jgi:TonB family protein
MLRYWVVATVALLLVTVGLATEKDEKEQPRIKKSATVEYPEQLKQAEIEGEVLLKVVIDEKGYASMVETIKATHPDFIPAAMAALKLMEFEPAEKNGRPVSAEAVLPFRWVLKDKKSSHDASLDEIKMLLSSVVESGRWRGPDSLIGSDARLLVEGSESSLLAALREKSSIGRLVGGTRVKVSSIDITRGPGSQSAYLIMRTQSGGKENVRLHSIFLTKDEKGNWRVRLWHAS